MKTNILTAQGLASATYILLCSYLWFQVFMVYIVYAKHFDIIVRSADSILVPPAVKNRKYIKVAIPEGFRVVRKASKAAYK